MTHENDMKFRFNEEVLEHSHPHSLPDRPRLPSTSFPSTLPPPPRHPREVEKPLYPPALCKRSLLTLI